MHLNAAANSANQDQTPLFGSTQCNIPGRAICPRKSSFLKENNNKWLTLINSLTSTLCYFWWSYMVGGAPTTADIFSTANYGMVTGFTQHCQTLPGWTVVVESTKNKTTSFVN